MPNVIQHKRNSTPGSIPGTGSLAQGELGLNLADGRLYTKNSSNVIINLPVTSISGTSITPASGNFSSYLAVNSVPVSISGHTHSSSDLTSIQLKQATATQWGSTNPVLGVGEPGWDTTNGILKIGNGTANWNSLIAINHRTNRGNFSLTAPSGTFNVTNGYTVGSLDVFLNGVKLLSDSEYTATNGTSFTLTESAPSGSIVEYLALSPGLITSSPIKEYEILNSTKSTFSVTGGYALNNIDVYHNGVRLLASGDYTATNGSTFTLSQPAISGDVVEWLGYSTVPKYQLVLAEVRSDTVGSTNYIGRAVTGSSEGDSVWTIKKYVVASNGVDITTTTASNVSWTNRLSASYV